MENYCTYLAEAIANYVNIFRPDVVLLSGGICNQGSRLTKPVEEHLSFLCFGGTGHSCRRCGARFSATTQGLSEPPA